MTLAVPDSRSEKAVMEVEAPVAAWGRKWPGASLVFPLSAVSTPGGGAALAHAMARLVETTLPKLKALPKVST